MVPADRNSFEAQRLLLQSSSTSGSPFHADEERDKKQQAFVLMVPSDIKHFEAQQRLHLSSPSTSESHLHSRKDWMIERLSSNLRLAERKLALCQLDLTICADKERHLKEQALVLMVPSDIKHFEAQQRLPLSSPSTSESHLHSRKDWMIETLSSDLRLAERKLALCQLDLTICADKERHLKEQDDQKDKLIEKLSSDLKLTQGRLALCQLDLAF